MTDPQKVQERPRLVQRDGRISIPVRGLRRALLSDLYFALLSARWSALFGLVALIYVAINVVFAGIYVVSGGIEGARPGSFQDAFFFSVQTMATIGYGVMHPKTPLANVLVTVEALLGLLGVAMATGVLFAKFARPFGALIFSNVAVVTTRDGAKSFVFRVANGRKNHVAEATVRVNVVRNEVTPEGERVRRWHQLRLTRDYSPVFALSWTIVHPIDDASPLSGATHQSLVDDQTEIVINMVGLDATLGAQIQARHGYVAEEILWGRRLRDIIVTTEDGGRAVDFTAFHETDPDPTGKDADVRSLPAA